jgi:hypothetical protein
MCRWAPGGVLVLFLAWGLTSSQAGEAAGLPWSWRGAKPAAEDVARARISLKFGGAWMDGPCILLATPNARGGYDVRIETSETGGPDAIYRVATYSVSPEKARKLREALAREDLSALPEKGPVGQVILDGGWSTHCLDFPDGRCAMFDAPWLDKKPEPGKEPPVYRVCALIDQTLPANAAHCPEEERKRLDVEGLTVAAYKAGDLAKDPEMRRKIQLLELGDSPGVKDLAGMVGPQLTLFTGPWTPEAIAFFKSRTSMQLALMGCRAELAWNEPASDEQRRAIAAALDLCRRDPWALHMFDYSEELGGALRGAALGRAPWARPALREAMLFDKPAMFRRWAAYCLVLLADERRPEVCRELTAALKLSGDYTACAAAESLVALGAREAGPELLKQAQADPAMAACALALGEKAAGPLLRDERRRRLAEADPEVRKSRLREFATTVSGRTGVPVLEADAESAFAGWPIGDAGAMEKLAVERLRRLAADPKTLADDNLKAALEYALEGGALRGWRSPEWRSLLAALPEDFRPCEEALAVAGGPDCLRRYADRGASNAEMLLARTYRRDLLERVGAEPEVRKCREVLARARASRKESPNRFIEEQRALGKATAGALARLAEWDKPEKVFRVVR